MTTDKIPDLGKLISDLTEQQMRESFSRQVRDRVLRTSGIRVDAEPGFKVPESGSYSVDPNTIRVNFEDADFSDCFAYATARVEFRKAWAIVQPFTAAAMDRAVSKLYRRLGIEAPKI